MIKQWLANWLLKNVRVCHNDAVPGTLTSFTIIGNGWKIETLPELGLVKPPEPEYVPRYNTRTSLEHQAIRDKIQKDPKTCRHLKGGGITNGVKDYNVLTHTFPNDRTRVRCGNCGRVWWNTDADWQDALRMVSQSTNTASSSEVRLNGELRNMRYLVTFHDSGK